MSNFVYKARKPGGGLVSGMVQAVSALEAVRKVKALGCVPVEVDIVPEAPGNSGPSKGGPVRNVSGVPLKALAVLFRQFFDLLEGGIPLARALQLLAGQKHPPELKAAVDGLLRLVVDGKSLSEAMAAYPAVFPAMHVQMIRAGEIGGNVDVVMGRLSAFIEQDILMRSKVREGLMYPGIVFAVGCLTLFVIMTFVIPRMASMFEDFGSELPLATKVVLGLAGFLSDYWWIIAAALAMAGTAGNRYLRSSSGRVRAGTFVLGLPVAGKFFLQVDLVRFSRTLATLIENGVAIAQAADAAVKVVDNPVLREALQKAAQRVREGASLVQALRSVNVIPNVGLSLVSVGEETGRLENGLYKMAALMERDNEEALGTFFTFLGPVLLVVVAGVVGFLVIAMLLPIFSLNSITR